MPNQNLISHTLSDEDFNGLMTQVQALDTATEFLVSLSPEERRRLPKLRVDHVAFIGDIKDVCTQNPGFLPRRFDMDEFNRDIALAEQLDALDFALSKLKQRLEDTLLAVKSDMYSSALEAYGYIQAAGDGDGLDVHRKELQRYFRRRRASASNDNAASDTTTDDAATVN